MKVGAKAGKQPPIGSFTKPPHVKKAIAKAERERYEPSEDQEEEAAPASTEEAYQNEALEVEMPEDTPSPPDPEDTVGVSSPSELFKDLGIKFTQEDFQSFLFRGYVEKDIVIVKNPVDEKNSFVATFRTLTGGDHDMIDELLAKELYDTPLQRDAVATRRSMWNMAFAIHKLKGKPIVKPVFKKDKSGEETSKVDKAATAKAKRKVLALLSPQLLDKTARIYSKLSVALTRIVEDPESDFLADS